MRGPASVGILGIALGVLACVSINQAVAATAALSEKHQKELIVFMMRAMGTNLGVNDVKNKVSSEELETMVATGLNMNGHLCATITDIRPLRPEGAYEVTCVAYRDGSAQKSYTVDALRGTASEP